MPRNNRPLKTKKVCVSIDIEQHKHFKNAITHIGGKQSKAINEFIAGFNAAFVKNPKYREYVRDGKPLPIPT